MTSSSLNLIRDLEGLGLGLVVMNKDEYSRLFRKASVDDKSKFREVSAEKPRETTQMLSSSSLERKSSVHGRSQDPSVGYR